MPQAAQEQGEIMPGTPEVGPYSLAIHQLLRSWPLITQTS